MKTTRKVATLTAALITFGSLVGGANGTILITELDHGVDYFEITNTTSNAINISGWTLNIQDDGLSNWSFTFSSGSSLAGGEVFGISDEAYFGAVDSTVNIPNASSRGIYAYVTDSSGLLHDAVSIVSGADTGGTIPSNYPAFSGSLDWSSAPAVSRTSNTRFEASSFSTVLSESPITSTSLSGTSSTALTAITGIAASAPSSVPEPSSALLFGLGALGLVSRRMRTASVLK